MVRWLDGLPFPGKLAIKPSSHLASHAPLKLRKGEPDTE